MAQEPIKYQMTVRADRDYDGLSTTLRGVVDKQLGLLVQNYRHPSLQTKKYDIKRNIWQGRVNRDYRFYFHIEGDTYEILTIIPHPK